MHRFTLFAALLLVTACDRQTEESTASGTPTPSGPALNVVLISVDTTRADHLGCYGHAQARTPQIDRLAEEGVRFAHCSSPAPVTLPSHASLLTGSYQFVHGVRANGTFRVDPANVTLAEVFQERGYRTHAEVAAPVLNHRYGLDQGFTSYGDLAKPDSPRWVVSRKDAPPHAAAQFERSAETITDAGLAFLREHGEAPFFLFLHYYDPHAPYEPPPPYDTALPDPYLGELAYFDEHFGRLMDGIRQLASRDRTLVILTSDHGEGLGQHGEMGHVSFLYDSNLHVPLIFWAPQQIPSGVVVDQQVRLIDVVPTVLELIAAATPPAVQGASLLALMRDPASTWDAPAYAETFYPKFTFGFSELRSLRTERWKYIHAPKPELYDITTDTGETNNLATDQPDQVAALREQMRNMLATAKPVQSSGAQRSMSAAEQKQLESLGYVGGPEEELFASDELERFEPTGLNPRDRVAVFPLLKAGMRQTTEQDWAAAAKTFTEMLEYAPDSAFAHTNLAQALSEIGQLDQALTHYRRALELKPTDTAPKLAIARILAFLGRDDEAEAAFAEAIQADGQWHAPHTELGRMRLRQRRFPEAVAALQRAVKLVEQDTSVELLLGRALQGNGQLAEAERIYRSVVARHDSHSTARFRLGTLLLAMGKQAEGEAELKTAYTQTPTDPRILKTLALMHARRGEHVAAGDYYGQLATLQPKNASAHYNLALSLHQADQLDAALLSYRQAVELDSSQPLFFEGLMQGLRSAGLHEDALQSARARISAYPEQPHAYRAAAGILADAGQTVVAIGLLETGRDNCPPDAALLRQLALLYEIEQRWAEAATAAEAGLQQITSNKQAELRALLQKDLARFQSAAAGNE